jgi:hypothetical protein
MRMRIAERVTLWTLRYCEDCLLNDGRTSRIPLLWRRRCPRCGGTRVAKLCFAELDGEDGDCVPCSRRKAR